MTEPAAKKDDKIISDNTSNVWVKPPGSLPPKPVPFAYEGSIDNKLCDTVFIMNKPTATVGSTATNSNPPNIQPAVTSQGKVLTENINNTATITTGSSTVFINGKKAARNGDKAKTWDYSQGPPGTPNEVENAKITATCSVYIGD